MIPRIQAIQKGIRGQEVSARGQRVESAMHFSRARVLQHYEQFCMARDYGHYKQVPGSLDLLLAKAFTEHRWWRLLLPPALAAVNNIT